MNKVVPIEGMAVTWIEPSEDPRLAKFIEEYLVGTHGTEGLRVVSVRDQGERFSGNDRWLVTLQKNGRTVTEKCGGGSEVASFSWHYLRPLS